MQAVRSNLEAANRSLCALEGSFLLPALQCQLLPLLFGQEFGLQPHSVKKAHHKGQSSVLGLP